MSSVEEWRAHQTAVSEKAGLGPLQVDGWVFPSQDWGHPISLNQITYDWRSLADTHGLQGVRFQDYADLRVMPTSVWDPLRGKESGLLMSA